MEQRTGRLTLKLLLSDKEALRELAKEQGETMAVLVRRLIRRELRVRDSQPRAGLGTGPTSTLEEEQRG